MKKKNRGKFSACGWIVDSAFNAGEPMDISGFADIEIAYSVELSGEGGHIYGKPSKIHDYITNNDDWLLVWQHVNLLSWRFDIDVHDGAFLFESAQSQQTNFASEAGKEADYFGYNVGNIMDGSGNWTNWPQDVASAEHLRYVFYDASNNKMTVEQCLSQDPAYIVIDWLDFSRSKKNIHLRLDNEATAHVLKPPANLHAVR